MKKKHLYLAVLLSLATPWATAGDDDKAADDKGADAKAAVSKVPNNWAYKPVASVAPPEVKRKDWVSTPIDNFILAKLEEKNIKPSPETERGNFIRRATLDAWGVLPSPEDVEAFEKDRS
ncbi:MAG TPA: DUF1549 domain-containing protein, partial [Cellvibrionaceae bacterium]|nr:DUF1549 domain-containing protein [Cellvibrionaceae bacterium]